MNPMTLTNFQLAHALGTAITATKETRGSENLKATRTKARAALEAEVERRINLGAW